MFRHLILGLLRDGQARHGYGLMTEYKARSGNRLSVGNLYRELARLGTDALVQSGVNPPDADPRRIPYEITDRGRQFFDQWLVAPLSQGPELPERLIFVDQVPRDALARLLDRWQEDLWIRGKSLARTREDALAATPSDPSGRYNSLASLLLRQMKHLTAELEFLKEFRIDFDAWTQSRPATVRDGRSAPPGTGRGGNRRDKGTVGK